MVRFTANGEILFRVYLPDAQRVELVGDFTDWSRKTLDLQREPPGWWQACVRLPKGDHLFCYLIDGCIRLADYAAHGVRLDRHGQWLSEVHVADASSTAVVVPPSSTLAV